MSDTIFAALADTNRRLIVESLAVSGSSTATRLGSDLGISRQATAKHLSLLAEAGLVSGERHGRETIYQPDPAALAEVTAWVVAVEHQWGRRLQRLADHVDGPSD